MQMTGMAVLIKIHVFCQNLDGYNLQFLEVMSLYYGEAGMRIERCREHCYDDEAIYKLLEINLLKYFRDEI